MTLEEMSPEQIDEWFDGLDADELTAVTETLNEGLSEIAHAWGFEILPGETYGGLRVRLEEFILRPVQ